MVPSGHIFPSNVLATRTSRGPLFIFTAAMLLHFVPLDAVPHIEPGSFAVGCLDMHHWTYWWTATDLAISSLITLGLFILLPDRRALIAAGYAGAILPDILGVGIMCRYPNLPVLKTLYVFHQWVHWWPQHSNVYRVIGTIATLAVWIVCYRLMPKLKPDEAIDDVEAVA